LIKNLLLLVTALISFHTVSQAQQVGYGLGLGLGVYDWYGNPPDDIASRSAGSVMLNVGIHPKMWFGGPDFAVSPEIGVVFSPLALSLGNYKGLGAVSFPLMVKFEFLGNSNFNKDGKMGFAIGGGVQYSETELWYLKPSFKSGFDAHVFVRYGWDNDTGANTFTIGIGGDINAPFFKEATNPDF